MVQLAFWWKVLNLMKFVLAEKTLATIRVPSKRGRPYSRFRELVADRAYHSKAFRQDVRKKGAKPIIPGRKSDKKRKGRHSQWATVTNNVGK
jgi:hypothetical protein